MGSFFSVLSHNVCLLGTENQDFHPVEQIYFFKDASAFVCMCVPLVKMRLFYLLTSSTTSTSSTSTLGAWSKWCWSSLRPFQQHDVIGFDPQNQINAYIPYQCSRALFTLSFYRLTCENNTKSTGVTSSWLERKGKHGMQQQEVLEYLQVSVSHNLNSDIWNETGMLAFLFFVFFLVSHFWSARECIEVLQLSGFSLFIKFVHVDRLNVKSQFCLLVVRDLKPYKPDQGSVASM